MQFSVVMFDNDCVGVIEYIFSEMPLNKINKLAGKILKEAKGIQKDLRDGGLDVKSEIELKILSCDTETFMIAALVVFDNNLKRRRLQRLLRLDALEDIWEFEGPTWSEDL